MSRLELVSIDLSEVQSSQALHGMLKEALGFPDWYGCNWDAFSGRLPSEAALLKKCLAHMASEYPESAPAVAFD
ncbi:barstar family protein [Pseudomonas sp. P42]|nr:barstar family protein [Pseudomonas sp. P42]MBP5953865.1 barstar family protein [Pseudomonas sp. P42]